MPVDYQNGKIYKIYNTVNHDIYIGSTSRQLCERMRDHRSNYKYKDKFKNLFNVKLYKAMEEYGVENFYIELIEKCPCNDIDELRKKEGEYIRLLKPSLNKQIAGRTKNEYREDNRETLLQAKKEWYENNKERHSENMKKWQGNNKEYVREHGKQYRENNKEYIREHSKQYRENNKEYIREHSKQYRENNKEYIKAYKATKIKCECGCDVNRNHLARHKRSDKHKELMNEIS